MWEACAQGSVRENGFEPSGSSAEKSINYMSKQARSSHLNPNVARLSRTICMISSKDFAFYLAQSVLTITNPLAVETGKCRRCSCI